MKRALILCLVLSALSALPATAKVAFDASGLAIGKEQAPMSSPANFTRAAQTARRFGVHEIVLSGDGSTANPFATQASIRFVPPSGATHAVTVDAFYDGENTWRARVYVSETGPWHWQSVSADDRKLDGRSGSFTAEGSPLRGMLHRHPRNPTQWATEDGRTFLNLNDAAYMLFKPSEGRWREYARDAWEHGITSLRVGALGGVDWNANDANTNRPWAGEDTARFDLERFRNSDERLIWMLDHIPDLYVQLILVGLKQYGTDLPGATWLALPQSVRENTMRYMIARWAAFPQLFWLVVNDADFGDDRPKNRAFAREVGRFFAAHDPWRHLMSAGPRRGQRFPFTTPEDDWATYVHIEHQYELGADAIAAYAGAGRHVFLGEDRYEQDRATRDPLHPAYYFRRLFWAWALSGGSASYGGRWRVIHPYAQTGALPYDTGWGGADEKHYTTRLEGLDSLPFLKGYFGKRAVDLAEFTPDDARVSDPGGRIGVDRPKVARRDHEEFVVYHPNAAGKERDAALAHDITARVRMDLRDAPGRFAVEWYRPADGASQAGAPVEGGAVRELTAPWKGEDVVLRVRRE